MDCYSFDNDTGLMPRVPCDGTMPMAMSLAGMPVGGRPPLPARGDKVVVALRARYNTSPSLAFNPFIAGRWGTAGVVSGQGLSTSEIGLGIITQVRHITPAVVHDKSDALGFPYGKVAYEAFRELSVSCIFLHEESPMIGDTIRMLRGGYYRIREVEETWTEGQFCQVQFQLIGTSGYTSGSPLGEIASLG